MLMKISPRVTRSEPRQKKTADFSPSFMETAKNSIEIVGKIAIGLFAIFYAIGIVVVNIHLNKFGVYSLSLFRLNYVAAGLWALMPIFIGAIVLLLIFSIFYQLSASVREFSSVLGLPDQLLGADKYQRQMLLALGILILGIVLTLLLIPSLVSMNIAFAVWTSILGGFLVIFLVFLTTFVNHKAISSTFDLLFTFFSTLFTLFVFGVYVIFFSYVPYGRIPSYLGGGSPKRAQLILDEDSKIKEKLESIGVIFRSSTLTANVQILMDTDSDYILMIESHDSDDKPVLKGLTLPKDVVKAILYDEIGGGGI